MFDTNPSRCDYALQQLTKEYQKNMLKEAEKARLLSALKPHRHSFLRKLLVKVFPSVTCKVCKPVAASAPNIRPAYRQK